MTQSESYPLTDATDVAILMHRDAHFGGSFPIMIEYYENEGIGCSSDFNLDQIKALADLELKVGENLAAVHLQGAEAERVSNARKIYEQLKKLYEVENPSSVIPTLIADLILSEEHDPIKEISAIVIQKKAAIPALLDLIRSEEFHDPLFPGYGRSPELAARCLGQIGDKSAIAALFEAIHENEFFEEDASMQALKLIGLPAKEFLLSILKSKPITNDNERAAIALIQFEDDPEVSKACFDLLTSIDINGHLMLATYLALGCSALSSREEQERFKKMSEDKKLNEMVRQDMKVILSKWK